MSWLFVMKLWNKKKHLDFDHYLDTESSRQLPRHLHMKRVHTKSLVEINGKFQTNPELFLELQQLLC